MTVAQQSAGTVLHGDRRICLVKDEARKPSPTTYPPLLPTLQTSVGMVLDHGNPKQRRPYERKLGIDSQLGSTELVDQHVDMLKINSLPLKDNLRACSQKVTQSDLLDIMRHVKRLDTEQAVAMVISFLRCNAAPEVHDQDTFEGTGESGVDELLKDSGVSDMLTQTHMWREAQDYELHEDARVASKMRKTRTILRIIGEDNPDFLEDPKRFVALLQSLRRRRRKCDNKQHLVFSGDTFPVGSDEDPAWTSGPSYRNGQDDSVSTPDTIVITKKRFRKIQRLIFAMGPPTDASALFCYDLDKFIKAYSIASPARLEIVKNSADPYAVGYSFLTAQRHMQRTVVSDYGWSRFLIPGEAKLLLQNRPDIMTSCEDILVRHATDLRALTAVKCPPGVKDAFSSEQDVKDRARKVCELMERYVKDFGQGQMANLVLVRGRNGVDRGPVDAYNKLCDELRDCGKRGKALGCDLQIGPVYKFLAIDIMAWNNGWKDDAFADGKVPGWVEYLSRVRMEDFDLCD